MKKNLSLIFSHSFLLAFIVWTLLVKFFDLSAIGPYGSIVGFSSINEFFHAITGVNMDLYNTTDWLGLIPVAFMLGFAILGLVQWIKRKNLIKVDYSILVLGGYYIVVFLVYFFFEKVVVNYRPILINGYLEASYPSSTTTLVLSVMPTAIMQLRHRIKKRWARKIINISLMVFTLFMVIARFVSGVHWFSDIIGGILLSTALVSFYDCICKIKIEKQNLC